MQYNTYDMFSLKEAVVIWLSVFRHQCDMLIVSPFIAIPALQPIVHDLFVLRSANKADAGKDLDTQREVVVSMLLRLIQYYQVTP